MKNNKMMRLNVYMITLVTLVSYIFTPIYAHAAIDLSRDKTISDEEGESADIPDTDDVREDNDKDGKDNADRVSSEEDKENIEWEYIQISDAAELIDFAGRCKSDSFSTNKYVKIAADITLAGTDYEPMPVFAGVFDGCGHKIDGFIYSGTESFAGFISKTTPTAVVRDVTIGGNVSPDNKQMVLGGVVGDNYGLIQNCKYIGIVKGNDYIGGITGFNESTGMIMDCESFGTVSGQHYVGGIAGSNAGGIYRSSNAALINTTNEDKSVSFDDINVDKYLSGILDISGDGRESKEINAANSVIDCGGIVGHSTGVVEFCTNLGDVGYEHVGYNVGGIVGRQSGYVHGCTNAGKVLGRKDVGGITGQAEPYVTLDLTEDIVNKLTTNINELHDLVDTTLRDTDGRSGIISDRLDIIKKFTDDALKDMDYISGETISWANGLTGAANEALGRVDYAVDEASKDGGAIDQGKNAAKNVKKAADALSDAADAADIYNYLSDEEKARYDAAKERIKNNSDEYQGYYDDVYSSYYYLYIDKYKRDNSKSYFSHEDDLKAYDGDGNEVTPWPNETNDNIANVNNIKTEYSGIKSIKHVDAEGNETTFPSTDTTQAEHDNALIEDAAKSAEEKAREYADAQYAAHGHSNTYSKDVTDDAKIMADIIAAHEGEMSADATDSTKEAMEALSDASDDLSKATSEVDSIASNISGRDNITLPSLGDSYRSRTNSFMSALQGMSDNMGQLNSEIDGSTDILTEDMEKVNDSFNTIMLLFTDAIDGVLDMDYEDVYEDESIETAMSSTDGTIADCTNKGRIQGDIDIAGIAGTMAIEYEFDLESDTTGIDDSRMGSVYKTKCVLRDNVNNGRIISGKSYAGGQTGLQELGMILDCENYGRIISTSGDYVGGIAGSSLSDIKGCYAKGILSGGDYIGGITGYGCNVSDCISMPVIDECGRFAGAVIGEVSDNYKVRDNFFYSDKLAGIDRISYEGMAEGLEYEELMNIEGLPMELRTFTVTFITDDEETDSIKLKYGEGISSDDYPKPLVDDGNYIKWDNSGIEDIREDIEVTGEEVRLLTTLASSQLRGNGQSVLLADGSFREDQSLESTEYKTLPDTYKGSGVLDRLVERWDIVIPDDGAMTHPVRLQMPSDTGRRGKYEIYAGDGKEYTKVHAGDMGIYKLFTVSGSEVSILIVDRSLPIWVYYVCGGVAAVLIAVMLTVIIKKLRNRKKQSDASAEDSESTLTDEDNTEGKQEEEKKEKQDGDTK